MLSDSSSMECCSLRHPEFALHTQAWNPEAPAAVALAWSVLVFYLEGQGCKLDPHVGQLALLNVRAPHCVPDLWLFWQPGGYVGGWQQCVNPPVAILCLLSQVLLMATFSCGLEVFINLIGEQEAFGL